jgi:Crp-like helix-turn-helix domain
MRRTWCFVGGLAVNNRIQAQVLRLANLAPQEGKSARIVPAPTHFEIASRIGTHREAVTRELSRLSPIGIIERQGGTLAVRDVAWLYGSRGNGRVDWGAKSSWSGLAG